MTWSEQWWRWFRTIALASFWLRRATVERRGYHCEEEDGASERPGAACETRGVTHARFTLTFSYAPHIFVSVTPGLSARWTRTFAFFPPAVM